MTKNIPQGFRKKRMIKKSLQEEEEEQDDQEKRRDLEEKRRDLLKGQTPQAKELGFWGLDTTSIGLEAVQ